MKDAGMLIGERYRKALGLDLNSPTCYLEPGPGEPWDPEMLRRKERVAWARGLFPMLNPRDWISREADPSSE